MPTVARDIATGYGRSVVVGLSSILIAVPLGLCGIMATVWLLTSSGSGIGTLILIAVIWMVPAVIAGLLFRRAVVQRARHLDALFVPLGMQGSAYMSFFRQYHGTVYGRTAAAYLWRGPFLQIEVATPVQTRMGVTGRQSDTSFFADLAGRTPLALSDPDLSALMVFAEDGQWARSLMAEKTATDALRRLTALGSSVFTRQQVIVRPGAVTLLLSGNQRLFGLDISPEQARLWVDDLVRLAGAAEALPAPTVIAQPSSAELFAQKLRTRNPYLEIWIGVGIAAGFALLGVIVAVAMLALGG